MIAGKREGLLGRVLGEQAGSKPGDLKSGGWRRRIPLETPTLISGRVGMNWVGLLVSMALLVTQVGLGAIRPAAAQELLLTIEP